ncbi:MAG: PEP-CTERM sorting domain-containing protein [Planctomycetota bacterium]|nr:PEP-CTERM sorting domain-containing protein [Planctomycetota bacterium]
MQFTKASASAGAIVVIAGLAHAQPVNTQLQSGWSWQAIGGGTYDTGLVGTARGGANGQTTGPFTDTSYGIMNEQGTPWYTGQDLNAAQYVQRQLFGNFGTSSPPGPAGTRYYNFGYAGPNGPTQAGQGATSAGSNFAFTAAERRNVTLNQWSNPFQDVGGIATFGQIVYVPVAATLRVGLGWGGDEMLIKGIGGSANNKTRIRVDANIDAAFSSSAFGGLSSTGNRINVNGITEFFNPASLGNYDMAWGYGVGLTAGQTLLARDNSTNFVTHNGVVVGDPTQGLTPNSVGSGFTNTYNVLSALQQDGSSFTFQFDSAAELFITRDFGDADARAQMGPGMEGNVQLVVQWAAFQAVPTPGSLALVGAGLLVAARRRRA